MLWEHQEGPWYWFSKKFTRPTISVEIKERISHSSGKYLAITINGYNYVMGLGEIGELKDRLYFIEGSSCLRSKDKTIIHCQYNMFNTYDYCLENKITNVQLFSLLIKEYKEYLVVQ